MAGTRKKKISRKGAARKIKHGTSNREFPKTGAMTRHAFTDDIGNPSIPEQEDFGGAGDLGTTGAVKRDIPHAAKIGVYDPKAGRPRGGAGDTGERRKRAIRKP
jgi:hypothetical protein